MRVLIAGATGLLGRALLDSLRGDGHALCALTRDPARAQASLGIPALAWDDDAAWQAEVAASDAVVNLCGAPIAGARWNPAVKEGLRTSRIEPTRRLAAAGPRVLIQASAVGLYGDCGEATIDESAPPADDFLARLAADWEAASACDGRVVRLRIGPVLARGGGMLNAFVNPPGAPFSPFKVGLGGSMGAPDAWMPWVHVADVVGLIRLGLENGTVHGPVNAVSPEPVRNQEFATALGRVFGKPANFPMPLLALRLLLGEFADYLSDSQRIVPAAALAAGYRFRFPRIDDALADLLRE